MKEINPDKSSISESKEKLLSLLREQFNLRMQKATGQLTQFHLLPKVRRNIARIKTMLRQQAGR